MLKKLLKLEGRTTARTLLPIGGGVLAFTVVIGLFNAILSHAPEVPGVVEMIQGLAMVLGVLALLFVVAACVFVNVQRFYKLLGEQGYLMLSLPVPAWQHIAAKLICACLWSVVTALYFLVCIAILGNSLSMLWPGNFLELLSPELALAWLLVILLLVAVLAAAYLDFYLACAVGAQFGHQRLLASIISFFVIGFLEQVLGMILLLAVVFSAAATRVGTWQPVWTESQQTWVALGVFAAVVLGFYLLDAIKWAITQWLMTRRLNLI